MKLNITKDAQGDLRALGIVTLKDARAIIKKKSNESIERLLKAGLIRVVWVSNSRCFIVKDLEKVRDNQLTPTSK